MVTITTYFLCFDGYHHHHPMEEVTTLPSIIMSLRFSRPPCLCSDRLTRLNFFWNVSLQQELGHQGNWDTRGIGTPGELGHQGNWDTKGIGTPGESGHRGKDHAVLPLSTHLISLFQP